MPRAARTVKVLPRPTRGGTARTDDGIGQRAVDAAELAGQEGAQRLVLLPLAVVQQLLHNLQVHVGRVVLDLCAQMRFGPGPSQQARMRGISSPGPHLAWNGRDVVRAPRQLQRQRFSAWPTGGWRQLQCRAMPCAGVMGAWQTHLSRWVL